jgi:hypothetical protein
VNSIIPEKFDEAGKDEPRLIIPFLNEDKELIGFQGRSFKKNDPLKYITIMLTEDPKIFGLDTLDKSERIYTFEGPIDAMFIENSIASAGGRLDTNLELAELDKSKCILVYDNEPRSPETVKKIQKSIKLGYQVCIWPENINYKDINDMVLGGYSPQAIQQIIDQNTYSGLTAEFMLTARKRI